MVGPTNKGDHASTIALDEFGSELQLAYFPSLLAPRDVKGNVDLMEGPFLLMLHEKQGTHVPTYQLYFDHLDSLLVLLQYSEH